MICKNKGFDFLELSIDESDEKLSRLDWSYSEIFELKKTMMETNTFIESICLSAHRKYPFGSHTENIRRKSLEIVDKAINLAAQLGVRYIQLAGYDVYYEVGDAETRRYFLKNLKKIRRNGQFKGCYISFRDYGNSIHGYRRKSYVFC